MSLITEKDVNGFSAVHYAAKKGNTAVRGKKETIFTKHFACESKKLDLIFTN